MIIPKELFNKKEYEEAMDEYLKNLYGIKDSKKSDKEELCDKPDCTCNDSIDKKP